MVEAQLPFTADPMSRIHGKKPDNTNGKDILSGGVFQAAVSLDAAAGNAEDARTSEDQPLETVSLDPELDTDEAVAALTQAVAAFIVSEASQGAPSHSREATGPGGPAINASPVAQLRAALPGLAGMASAAVGAQQPGGPGEPGSGTQPADKAAAQDATAGDVRTESDSSAKQVGSLPAQVAPDTGIPPAVLAETFRLPGAAAPVAAFAVARAMTAVPAYHPARPIDPPWPPAAQDAAPSSGIGDGQETIDLVPGAGEAHVATTAIDPGRRPAAELPEAGPGSVGTDRSPVASVNREGEQPQPAIAGLPADAGAAQRAMPQQPQSIASETEPAGRADGRESAPARVESPPTRPASESVSSSPNSVPAGDAAKPQSGGQVLPNPTATILFAQLPGLAGAQAASPAEQLRPILPARGDFSPSAPLRYLEIVLAPPELGTVRVVITREEGEMRIEMIASTSQAVDMLESARESMVDAIRDTGLRAGSIDIRQDLQGARPTGAGDFANGSAWNGRHEQGRHQGPENWQAARGNSYGQAVRTAEPGAQNQGLIL